MKKLFLLTLILVTGFCLLASAQTYEAPVHYKFTTQEEYASYEQKVVETVDWLQATPWSTDIQKQRDATAFLFKWIQGTPSIVMELMPKLMSLTDRNNKLMATFMGAYAKYAIQHPGYNKDDANIAAVHALIEKYQSEAGHAKDADIERLIKIDKDGHIDDWVRDEYERS